MLDFFFFFIYIQDRWRRSACQRPPPPSRTISSRIKIRTLLSGHSVVTRDNVFFCCFFLCFVFFVRWFHSDFCLAVWIMRVRVLQTFVCAKTKTFIVVIALLCFRYARARLCTPATAWKRGKNHAICAQCAPDVNNFNPSVSPPTVCGPNLVRFSGSLLCTRLLVVLTFNLITYNVPV